MGPSLPLFWKVGSLPARRQSGARKLQWHSRLRSRMEGDVMHTAQMEGLGTRPGECIDIRRSEHQWAAVQFGRPCLRRAILSSSSVHVVRRKPDLGRQDLASRWLSRRWYFDDHLWQRLYGFWRRAVSLSTVLRRDKCKYRQLKSTALPFPCTAIWVTRADEE